MYVGIYIYIYIYIFVSVNVTVQGARRSDLGPRAEQPRSRDSSSTRASLEQQLDPRPRADQPRAAACFGALRCKEASDLESTTSESSSLVC